jgi:hypothetical protein
VGVGNCITALEVTHIPFFDGHKRYMSLFTGGRPCGPVMTGQERKGSPIKVLV